jgi:hypothetical protein
VTDRPRSSADDSPEVREVRRLLAESRHTDPMPDDVATQMDRVLAGLSSTPAAPPVEPVGARDAEVVPIGAHRRRRAAGLLVAAAAIVVGGFAVAQNLPSPGQSGGPATSAAEDRPQAGGDTNAGKGPSQDTGAPEMSSKDGRYDGLLRHGRVVVRPRHFTDDALESRRLLGLDLSRAYDLNQACADLAGQARAVPAEYRHAPAALVFRRPEGTSQVVDLFVCGTPQPVRSTTLPAP